ncbi:MAG: deoxyguanosinetriphosphate triphosphohydrolase [Nitrospinaceae bacterium]|nr:deoxyguanosinetriphosphate triphosphohydrolase [Nitrospinaceae bacterium]NIR55353.1 deoxyguanosinetriphosphate triphosphohydrolase [Nitrospinaceae bacterium]NIS85792.1 deoxyguanosinetriphosphate triphosphohydrolase [Nitrospinaceae bacterium]NIT82642.1 deoxyguanosinetriphosphate triphosphohydrolase [Nitrospinaceae bacterium]NIU44847.1 deoxyguanosinetriphosphate triphosphohydrolase [Nitrospinaceae bacterium]
MIKRQDIETLENEYLAPYSVKSGESWGRRYPEEEHTYRTRFQRDRDRVIHTSAFRKLEYKTQVFVYHEGDYYRTRLTHSLEVAQITRSICKSLQLNEDLAEAIALAHDLGHPPFGHTGQDVLNQLMKDHGGFEHNQQSLRIVNILEKRYPEFEGLNLTWEVQEGISKRVRDSDNPLIQEEGHRYPSLEGQVADFADGIAYNAHDLDDGITSNLINAGQLREVALWHENEKRLEQEYTNLEFELKKYQIVRRIINDLITDFRKTTQENIAQYGIRSVGDVRSCTQRVAGFSKEIAEKNNELKKFLFKNMYHHRRVRRMEFKAELYLSELFKAYTRIPQLLPEVVLANEHQGPLERRICDYISGMTDRSSIDEYKKLFSPDEKD